MAKVEDIEKQLRDLSPQELAEFRARFAALDAEVWDRQFEADVEVGKLDALAESALRAHAEGCSTKL